MESKNKLLDLEGILKSSAKNTTKRVAAELAHLLAQEGIVDRLKDKVVISFGEVSTSNVFAAPKMYRVDNPLEFIEKFNTSDNEGKIELLSSLKGSDI